MGLPIRLERVSHRYGESEEAASVEALRAIDLEIAGGEYVALMGPSGSGKSTLLNLLGAVDRATSGSVVIGSTDTSALDERALTLLRRNEIGFIFQFFNLIPTLNVSENIAFPLALQKRPRPEVEERVRELVAAVGLEGRAAHFPQQLSGGEMQRVAIARAIVHRPGLILADEPTGNLDIGTGDVILELIDSVHRMFHPTIVMATHSDRAVSHAGRVVHVVDGRIEQP